MPEFKIINVTSSSIKSYGYDKQLRILRVWFLNGHVYDYIDVPNRIFERLQESPSKGEYINRIIKEFIFRKIA
ncbi:MAG: KTSC domain-containing protein [Ignavibacteriae bacterium]|nr:MAG: KTSC domain-containing protein [Ignavibacteriota bacterium]